MKKIFNKKGQNLGAALYGLLIMGLFLIIVGYVLSFGADFTDDARSDIVTDNLAANCGLNSTGGTAGVIEYSACPLSYNVTVSSLEAMQDVGDAQGTVGTVGILVIVVGLLVGVIAILGFAGRKQF